MRRFLQYLHARLRCDPEPVLRTRARCQLLPVNGEFSRLAERHQLLLATWLRRSIIFDSSGLRLDPSVSRCAGVHLGNGIERQYLLAVLSVDWHDLLRRIFELRGHGAVMTPHCRACPVSSDVPCWFGERGLTRACEAVAAGLSYVIFQAVTRSEPEPWFHMEEPPATPADPLDSKLIAAIEGCDFRWSSCSCLGRPARCTQAGYPAIVVFDDCRRCVEASDRTVAL